MIKPLRLGILFDQSAQAGGGYHQALNAALLVKKLPPDLVQPIYYALSMEAVNKLKYHGISAHFISMPVYARVILRLRRLVSMPRLLKLIQIYLGYNYFERMFIKQSVDLVYFLSSTHWALDLEKLNYITTVWDLCHRDDPEFPENREYRRFEEREWGFRKILPKAIAILVDSNFGRSRLCHRYGIDHDRVYVMPFSPSIGIADLADNHNDCFVNILEKYNITCPYIFYPAQFWPHKNHIYILEGLKLLDEIYGRKVGAVFAGSDKGNLSYVKEKAEEIGIMDRVWFTGYVSDSELPFLYRQSIALVMPTYFGPTNIPPLEAFSLNVPVLYPDKPGLREQVGESALLLDLIHPESLAHQLERLLTNQDLCKKLTQSGRDLLSSKYTDEARIKILEQIIRDFRRRRNNWD